MASEIKIPNSAWHEQSISVSGDLIQIVFKFNTRDDSWYIDLLEDTGEGILYGIKVMPNQSLTGRYSYLDSLPSGNLWCLRVKNDFSPINRNNLGIGEAYSLFWLSEEEEKEWGLDGKVQL